MKRKDKMMGLFFFCFRVSTCVVLCMTHVWVFTKKKYQKERKTLIVNTHTHTCVHLLIQMWRNRFLFPRSFVCCFLFFFHRHRRLLHKHLALKRSFIFLSCTIFFYAFVLFLLSLWCENVRGINTYVIFFRGRR